MQAAPGVFDDRELLHEEMPARPHVTIHFAQSIDGRIATRSGDAKWISGPLALKHAHVLRAECGAVIIGSGTALTDNPLLTVRHVNGRHPMRVVLDGRGRMSAELALVTNRDAETIQVSVERRATAPHVTCWVVPPGPDGHGVDPATVLVRLAEAGVKNVLVEGGGRIITSFLRAGLADRLIVCVAPMIVGAGVEAVGDLDVAKIAEARKFSTKRVWQLGDDTMIELVRA